MGHVDLLPGGEHHMLDRYQLVGEIAAGGMATVYLARLPGVGGFQRFVAIKRLHPQLAREQGVIEMFLDEARLAARIHHRNVVPILEIGTSEGGYYLVMEYIEGVTLARLMTQATAKRQPVPRPVLVRVMIDTLSGLHAAHELTDDDGHPLGVVHRDCSPQNILIGLDGCTRITDFGIARATARIHNTREGAMKGKLAYMAPEQTHGEGFDRRADLFSVAVVLWEVMSARRLFKGTTEAQTLRRLLHDPVPRLSEVVPDIDPGIDAVCARGLERSPERRFQTAAEMADALEQAARRSGPDAIASERTVEAVMRERYGLDVSQQRDALRVWLQATPTSRDEGPRTVRGLGDTATVPRQTVPSGGAASSSAPPASSRRPPPPRRSAAAADAEQPPDTKRSWPADRPKSAPSFEDDTRVYDPTSTTGVTAEPYSELRWPSPHSEEPVVVPKSGSGIRWLVATVAALGVAALVVVLVRSRPGGVVAEEGAAEERSAEQVAPPAASVAEPEPPERETAEPVEPGAAPEPEPSAPRPAPRARPRAVPRPTPAPKASASSSPSPPEIDDLTNPYR